MAQRKPQTLANHTRLDPLFHLFLFPLSIALFFWQAVRLARHPSAFGLFLLILTLVLSGTVFMVRNYAVKVQDRIIRVEERLRLRALLPSDTAARLEGLTEPQLIALRFASDAELPALAERAMAESLTSKQIKQSVRNWRPDYWRV